MARMTVYEIRARDLGILLPNISRRLQALSSLATQLHPYDYKVYTFFDSVLQMIPNLPSPRHGRKPEQSRHSVSPAAIAELVFERQVAFQKLQHNPQDLSRFGMCPVALLDDLEHRWALIQRCHNIEHELMTTLMLYFGSERHRTQFTNVRFAIARVCHRRLMTAAVAVKEAPWLKVYLRGFLANVGNDFNAGSRESDAATMSCHADSDGGDDCPICSVDLFQSPEDTQVLATNPRPEIASCPCCHQCMHVCCLVTWIEKQDGDDPTCPMCRAKLSNSFQGEMLEIMAEQLEAGCNQFSRFIEI